MIWSLNPTPRSDRLEYTDRVSYEQILCSLNTLHKRPGKRRTGISVIVPSDYDFRKNQIAWTWTGDCLLSARVAELLVMAKVQGFDLEKVSMYSQFGPRLEEEYFELKVSGWGGLIDKAHGVLDVVECEGCGHLSYSVDKEVIPYVDPARESALYVMIFWPFPKFIFVTDGVKSSLMKAEVPGVEFKAVPNSINPITRSVSPGRLSYYFNERALAISGAPSSIW